MNRLLIGVLGVVLVALGGAACSDSGSDSGSPSPTTEAAGPTASNAGPTISAINPADFQATVDNPLFPLTPGDSLVYEGDEQDPDTGETVQIHDETRVLPQTETIAGVETTVVEDKVFQNGELVESTLDYYAQHVDGTVYYFGERVDNYEDGEIVDHEGSWLAGEGENLPGIFMPANPQVGDEFDQERAPGIAEDSTTVLAIEQSVTVAAGAFTGCIKTEDVNPLDNTTEHKYYCPAVGFVREETEPAGQVDLVSY